MEFNHAMILNAMRIRPTGMQNDCRQIYVFVNVS